MRRLIGIIIVFVIFWIFPSCTSKNSDKKTENSQGNEITVYIREFKFVPEKVEISVGDSVLWINDDSVNHSVNFQNIDVDSDTMKKTEKFSYVFTKKGTFNYICAIHPMMTGQIIVK